MKRAQSLLEYVLIVATVVAGLMAMQLYVKRSVQARLKDLADELAQQGYNPGRNTISGFTTTRTYDTVEKIAGRTATTYLGGAPANEAPRGSPEVTIRSGYELSEEQ